MKICAVVFLLGVTIRGAEPMIHTVRYIETISSQISGFPQYVMVGSVNNLEIMHYDNNTKRTVPKQQWMNRMTEEEPKFWETETQRSLHNEQVGKGKIETAKQRLNETGDSHLYQRMYGCDWDDETGEIRGYHQSAFDGEDFIVLDWTTQTWVAPKQQAFPTKLEYERIGEALRYKNYFEHRCAETLKRYVRYGEKTLKRKELPLVAFLQKSSSSRVTCFASGFYPNRAKLFWTKDGEELQEDWGEILPNHDGTFQGRVSLDLSSVPTGDWGRYSCVFQLSGDYLITKLDPGLIRTNEKKNSPGILGTVLGAVFGAALGAVVCFLIGFFLYRRYKAEQLSPQSSEPEVMQTLNPQPPETQ